MAAADSPFSSTFRRRPWSRAVVHAALIVGSLVFIFPVLWMLSTSLKPIEQTLTPEPVWLPHPVEWRNYAATVEYIPFFERKQQLERAQIVRERHAGLDRPRFFQHFG